MEGKSLTWSPNRAKFSSPRGITVYVVSRPSLTRLINRETPFHSRDSSRSRFEGGGGGKKEEFSFFSIGEDVFSIPFYRDSSVKIRMGEARTS